MKSGKSTLAAWLHRLDAEQLGQVLAARPDAVSPPEPRSVSELADRLQRPGSVALVLPRLTLPTLQAAEALAALSAPVSREALADLLDATEDKTAPLDGALQTLSAYALVWPDSEGTLHMATPLRQAWHTPLGLDQPLATLLKDTTSEELRRMLTALGLRPPGTKAQRLASLVDHHSDPARVAAVVAQAPAETRKLLERKADSAYQPQAFVLFGGQSTPERVRAGRWSGDCWSRVDTDTALCGCLPRWRSRCAGQAGMLRSTPRHPSHLWCPSPRRRSAVRRPPRPQRSPPTPPRSCRCVRQLRPPG